MRSALAFVALGVAGCYNPSPPAGAPCTDDNGCPSSQHCVAGFCGGSSGSGVDAPALADAAPDVPLCATWNAKHFDACAIPAPPGDLNLDPTLANYSWDTSSGTLKGKANTTIPVTTMVLMQTNGPDVLLASVKNFTLAQGADLTITGSRPLLLAVWGSATIDGNISVAGSLGGSGPGANDATQCATSFGVAGANGSPATGGGGGAFQGSGGRGGNTGGAGGASVAIPAIIRGGCAGGAGGTGTTTPGPRGGGGGAIQITALDAITINGVINAAGGGGGLGRAVTGAGGGGGSGGFIGLDSKLVTIAGTLAANGGGGGGGASDVANASNGTDGRTTPTVASGGPGAATSNIGACGRGGNGAASGALNAENGVSSACGGGGGGGGVGYIVIWSPAPTVMGTITPPASGGP